MRPTPTVECTYTLALYEITAGTNTATASFTFADADLAYFGTADIAEDDYEQTIIGQEEVNVTDDLGTDGTDDDKSFGPVSVSTEFGYTSNYSCPTDQSLYEDGHYQYSVTNTATIDETDDSERVRPCTPGG